MGKLFDTLELNFDTTKFGNALDPRNNLNDKIVQSQAPLKKWQYDAVANMEYVLHKTYILFA